MTEQKILTDTFHAISKLRKVALRQGLDLFFADFSGNDWHYIKRLIVEKSTKHSQSARIRLRVCSFDKNAFLIELRWGPSESMTLAGRVARR